MGREHPRADEAAAATRLLLPTARELPTVSQSRLGGRAQSFVAHHLGEISTAVQVADAETVANRAAHIAFTRSLGMR